MVPTICGGTYYDYAWQRSGPSFPLILSFPPTLQPANFEMIKIIINFNQNLWTEKLLKICLIIFLLRQIDQLPTYVY